MGVIGFMVTLGANSHDPVILITSQVETNTQYCHSIESGALDPWVPGPTPLFRVMR